MDKEGASWGKIQAVIDEVNALKGGKGGDLTRKELKKLTGIGAFSGGGDTAYGLSKALLNLYMAVKARELP